MSCFDGESALKILEDDPLFDLIVLDKRMPGMGGIEAGKAIKRGERTSRIPIILLSASLQAQPAGRRSDQGVAGRRLRSPSPSVPQHLLSTVKKLLQDGRGG